MLEIVKVFLKKVIDERFIAPTRIIEQIYNINY